MGKQARHTLELLRGQQGHDGLRPALRVVGDNSGFVEVPGCDVILPRWPGATTPELAQRIPTYDPHYLFAQSLAEAFQLALGASAPAMLLLGPPGDGKTTIVEQIASLTGAPLFTVAGNADQRAHDLIGHHTITGGRMTFEPGVVPRAFAAGAWLLIDEITGIDSGVLMALHAIIAGSAIMALAEGETVHRGPGFRLFATSNVAGSAATERHRYVGNHSVNHATFSRFGLKVRPEPLLAGQVCDILLRHALGPVTMATERAAIQLASWFTDVRRAALASGDAEPTLGYMLTLRELLPLWHAWLTPVRTKTGPRRRTLCAAVDVTIRHAFESESELEHVLELLDSSVEEID